MKIKFWQSITLLLPAAVVGVGGILVSLVLNHYASTDSFCTSCHGMKVQATDPLHQSRAFAGSRAEVNGHEGTYSREELADRVA